jgi:acetyltransferase
VRKRKRFGIDIESIFEPSSVAIIGASEADGSPGTAVLKNMLKAKFKGKIYPVNPKYEKVQRRRCYPDVASIPGSVDLAVIATPARTVAGVLDACGIAEIPGAVVISAGFREAGSQGRALENAVLKTARKHGIRFLGPNCLGVMRPDIGLNATFSELMPPPGGIALVSQSGALATAILDWAKPRGIGFSNIVSTGISADLDFGEILDYLVVDAQTRAIMMYVEGLHDARRFMSAIRAASRAKPVVVMKAGRHTQGMRAAASHTGALVGSDDVFDTALRRAGVVRVQNYANFFAAAATLHAGIRTPGPRLAIVTNGGGPGVMAADVVADRDIELSELSGPLKKQLDAVLPAAWSGNNPVDVLGDAPPERYADAVRLCLEDDGVDAVLAILVPQDISDPTEVARALAGLELPKNKPLLTCWMGEASVEPSRKLFRKHGMLTYNTPEAAVAAFAAAANYRANQALLLQVAEPMSRQDDPDVETARMIINSALDKGRKTLGAMESKALLAAFRIPILRSVPARDPVEAVTLAQEIGFPVAMKIRSPDITHKTDVDGVRLGLRSGADVRAAWREIMESVASHAPDASVDGVTLEAMWQPENGREIMLGVLNDPVFGPVISVGLGGTLVEVIRDRAIGLPPLNRYLAERMIDRTRAARYLESFRGKPAANRDGLVDIILRVSEMVCELPELVEMDINPLVIDEEQLMAVDARIMVRRAPPGQRPYDHMSIHPYPSTLVETTELPDGTVLQIRPIRPEDARIEKAFVERLSERSRYLRFMQPLTELSPEMLSRFTQIDYDREMALIAVVEEDGEEVQVGVARYIMHPHRKGCEFAIAISDEWQGRGIATRLLEALIAVARDRRLKVMDGIVLRENRGMLKLADRLGFRREADPDDPDLVVLNLEL